MGIEVLIVLGLAVFRISYMIVNEDGPFSIFPKFKHRIGVRYNQHSDAYGTNEFAKLFICVWCLSVWIGLAVVVGAYFFPAITFWILLPFALSAVAMFVSERMGNG